VLGTVDYSLAGIEVCDVSIISLFPLREHLMF
jgi:hypothetical protein